MKGGNGTLLKAWGINRVSTVCLYLLAGEGSLSLVMSIEIEIYFIYIFIYLYIYVRQHLS